jgi:hypothetical protein
MFEECEHALEEEGGIKNEVDLAEVLPPEVGVGDCIS